MIFAAATSETVKCHKAVAMRTWELTQREHGKEPQVNAQVIPCYK